MSFLDRIRDVLSGQHVCPPEHLEGYKRLGEQVYEVEVELADCENAKACAILQAAKSFQIMANALLRDAFSSTEHESMPVPVVTHEQAEAWYGRIPDLLVAARQEASYPESAKVTLPIRMEDRIELEGPCPVQHLVGMRRAAEEMESLFKERTERKRLHGDKYKEVILRYEEARTRRQAGDAIVGSVLAGQYVPKESHEEAEEQYFATLSSYLLIAQGLEDPNVLEYVSFLISKSTSSHCSSGWNSTNTSQGGRANMNFQQMEQQANMIQQHNGNIIQHLQQAVSNIQSLSVDERRKQAIIYALRELALSVKGLNQETMGLVQNMAMYIQNLEQSHPQYQQYQQPVQQRSGGMGSGMLSGNRSGFWDTLLQSAEMGAGFAIGEDIVDDIFRIF